MRYFIHIAAERIIDYDDDGHEFFELADARAYAIETLRIAYMTPDRPPRAKMHSLFICISDANGTILDRVTFAEAFITENGRPAVSHEGGTT